MTRMYSLYQIHISIDIRASVLYQSNQHSILLQYLYYNGPKKV